MLWDEGESFKNYLEKRGIELFPTTTRGGDTILSATTSLESAFNRFAQLQPKNSRKPKITKNRVCPEHNFFISQPIRACMGSFGSPGCLDGPFWKVENMFRDREKRLFGRNWG